MFETCDTKILRLECRIYLSAPTKYSLGSAIRLYDVIGVRATDLALTTGLRRRHELCLPLYVFTLNKARHVYNSSLLFFRRRYYIDHRNWPPI